MMAAQDIAFLTFGTAHTEPPPRHLALGPWALDVQSGNLRTIRFLGHEVLRAVAFLVRDKDWGTCTAEISDVALTETESAIRLTYTARYTSPTGAHLDCQMQIELLASDALTFTADCLADADFETARAGFTVLHPILGLAGSPVTITHGDGRREEAHWPDAIEPWQPFMDISAITHQVTEDLSAETLFAGDIFEMEDQRNWTDGSYKTYVRPLALPWPYSIHPGAPFRQSVMLQLRQGGTVVTLAEAVETPVQISIEPADRPLFELGMGLRPQDQAQELAGLSILSASGARHLICHFDPLAGHGLEALRHYAEIAAQSGLSVTLECALPCLGTPLEELEQIAALVLTAGLDLDTLFVSPSVDRQSRPPGSTWPECPPLEDVYEAAAKAFPGVRLGGGMLSYFTELNRKRVPGDRLDYISHCTNPIVHAADDLSVMQTFEALGHVVCSTRALYGNKPYRVGPSTIAMRQNPYGSATKDNPDGQCIPMANRDPRHNGLFGAAWSIAYAATVADADLEVLTLSTLSGPFGLVSATGEPMPEGKARPLFHAIAGLGALSGQRRLRVISGNPAAILGLGSIDEAGRSTLWLANISAQEKTVHLPKNGHWQISILDAQALSQDPSRLRNEESSDRLTLQPYAIARISD